MFFILSFLWFIRETKAILFWLYLWQLKEYHIGRFVDHFQTDKGKRLIFNKLLIFKILLVLIFLYGFSIFGFRILPPPVFSPNSSLYLFELFVRLPFLILILYIFEAVYSLFGFFQKKLKKPVLTKKTITLISAILILEVLFLSIIYLYVRDEISEINLILAAFCLLIFDVLTPMIASGIVLIFQPIAVLGRNKIIRKAKQKRAKFKNLIVIGITGSYGKTSTKEFLATILSEKFKVLKTAEHQNSEVGISQCILNDLKPEHEIFIVEMGAYNRGGIKLLCDIAKPKIGILTGINEQHMATFGSQENIIKGKYELIETLPPDGVAFFNAKNKYCLELYQKANVKKFLYGQGAKLLGEENILGAMVVAREMGLTEEEIFQAVEKIENKLPGIQLKKGINGLNIIDATYSANPDGVMAHLEYLKTFPGKKVIVMPCLIELGKASKEVHKRIGRKIGQVCDLAIITTKDKLRELRDEAIKNGLQPSLRPPASGPLKKENILFIENPKEILEKIKSFCQSGDIILLESRVPAELIEELVITNQ